MIMFYILSRFLVAQFIELAIIGGSAIMCSQFGSNYVSVTIKALIKTESSTFNWDLNLGCGTYSHLTLKDKSVN